MQYQSYAKLKMKMTLYEDGKAAENERNIGVI